MLVTDGERDQMIEKGWHMPPRLGCAKRHRGPEQPEEFDATPHQQEGQVRQVDHTMGAAATPAIMGYHMEVDMTALLIRAVPEEVVAALDAHAARLGLSRSEYVRRRLAQDAATPGSPVSVADLARFAGTFADLADPDVMSQAWT